MIPQTRHYVDREVIFNSFSECFVNYKAFMATFTTTMWEVNGAEFFRNHTWAAGANHPTSPYAMKEVAALCSLLLHKRDILATHAVLLYHENHGE